VGGGKRQLGPSRGTEQTQRFANPKKVRDGSEQSVGQKKKLSEKEDVVQEASGNPDGEGVKVSLDNKKKIIEEKKEKKRS